MAGGLQLAGTLIDAKGEYVAALEQPRATGNAKALQLRLRPVAFETVLLEDAKNLLAEKPHLPRIRNFLSRQYSRQQYPHEHEKPLRY